MYLLALFFQIVFLMRNKKLAKFESPHCHALFFFSLQRLLSAFNFIFIEK